MAPTQLLGTLPLSTSEAFSQRSPFVAAPRAPESHRVLASSREDETTGGRHQPISTTPEGPPSIGSYSEGYSVAYPKRPSSSYQSLPVAFLNLDLVIQKSNKAFQDLVAFLGDPRGKFLLDFLESRQNEVLQRLRTELRDERDEREPTYMAPITPVGQDPMQPVMQSISEKDIDQVSQGYTDRPVLLNFRLQNGHYQSLQTHIRLAKTSLYFVTLVVHTPPRSAGPPLLTQQLAPPTPVGSSQTMSAPTATPSREFGAYALRPTSSASSAPTSPYFNFNSVRTSLPTVNSSSYGGSPYGYSPTAGPEQGYFPTYQPPSQPGAYPSSYQPVTRTGLATSEAQREGPRPPRLEGLQLPPIRTTPAPLASPLAQEFGEGARERERARRRMSLTNADARPDAQDSGKRRRLNIHEVLE